MTTALDHRRPVARKAHRCEWCRTAIERGERHELDVGIYDGAFYATRMHSDCREAAGESADEYTGEYCPERHERGARCNC